jgi:hypothetical protein
MEKRKCLGHVTGAKDRVISRGNALNRVQEVVAMDGHVGVIEEDHISVILSVLVLMREPPVRGSLTLIISWRNRLID